MSRRAPWSVIVAVVALAGLACADQPRPAVTARSHVLYADSTLQIKRVQAIQITVQGTATFDSVTRNYTYSYTVTNEASSTGTLNEFALKPVPAPLSIASPAHWEGGHTWQGDSTLIGWIVSDSDTGLPANDTGNIYSSPYNTPPGQSVSGFGFVSRKPPTTITFYAQAFDTLPGGDDDIGPPTLVDEGVTGSIVGPDITSLVDVGGTSHRGGGIEFRPPQPNPALGIVSLSFVLPATANVSLAVHDVSGRTIRLLVSGTRAAGVHSVTWNGRDDAGQQARAGVYFYKLLVNGAPAGERRVVILK